MPTQQAGGACLLAILATKKTMWDRRNNPHLNSDVGNDVGQTK